MWAAGRRRAGSWGPGARAPADLRSWSRPASGASSVLAGPDTVTLGPPSPPPSCSESTLSLLSPLGHQSFPSDDDVDADVRGSGAAAASPGGAEARGRGSTVESEDNEEQQNQVCSPECSLTPWEVWFVGKEKEERGRLQQKALEKRKEKEQKINKEMEEKAAKELKKEHLQEKAKEKYEEWLKKKNAEECEKKKKEKEKEKQRQAELQEKKEIAEKKFKEWLEKAKNKPRPAAKSYGYANGKLTGFYSGNSYPEPAFYNPIPWKPIPVPPPKEAKDLSSKKTARPVPRQLHRPSSLVSPVQVAGDRSAVVLINAGNSNRNFEVYSCHQKSGKHLQPSQENM
ncbi:coiled-coil domain-containing protein 34 isoform X2 [Equus caballus]|uniref:coiled-coil domain-containing protein 34 isoform X2 n=1 Tax=Equus caballus TaxID=9796 RepID=UPI0038B28E50